MPEQRTCCIGFSVAAATVLAALTSVAGEKTEKIVDFRDGTILRIQHEDVELPWRRISAIGEIKEEPVKLSQVQQLRFVLTPATEQVATVRRLIAQLGAERYQDRDKAQYELVEKAGRFRPILEQSLLRAKDYEVKWRLEQVVKKLDDADRMVHNDYDQLLLKDGGSDPLEGDAGRWEIRPKYRGAEVLIDRANVLAIRDAPADFKPTAEPEVVHVQRIERDDDSHFPNDAVRIDFDRDPEGRPLQSGTDLSEVYVPVGCLFETSFADSFVGVEPYNVGGRSGGHCAATHSPLYQGIMTIRFCKPGNPRVPAGVRYVGFWVSHVAVDGTSLQAYDARDRMIAEIKTLRPQRDFLAITTNVPMAYVKVVPDPEIDPDYAIDDLVFDTPRPLSEAGDPDRFSVVLTTGERLYCTGFEKSNDTVILKELTVGISEIQLPADEVLVFVPPRTPLPEDVAAKWCFVRLADGSVLRAGGMAGIHSARFQELAISPEQLVALWGARTQWTQPPDGAWPKDDIVLIDKEEVTRFKEWKLGANWIETGNLPEEFKETTYQNSPMIWFRQPSKRPPSSGLLRTSWGEEIVLNDSEGFQLKSWSQKGVTVGRGDHQWTVRISDVSSLLLPQQPGG